MEQDALIQQLLADVRQARAEAREALAEVLEARAEAREARAETTAKVLEARAEVQEARADAREAHRQLDAARQAGTRLLEEARVRAEEERIRAEERHQAVMRELGEIKNRLAWKSRTSTMNPEKLNLTHKFAILAGRKQRTLDTSGTVKDTDVLLEGRDPIKIEQIPTLRENEVVRVRLISGQAKYVRERLAEYADIGEQPLHQGYMAGGIDIRQNVKTAGKRKHIEIANLTGDVSIRAKMTRSW